MPTRNLSETITTVLFQILSLQHSKKTIWPPLCSSRILQAPPLMQLLPIPVQFSSEELNWTGIALIGSRSAVITRQYSGLIVSIASRRAVSDWGKLDLPISVGTECLMNIILSRSMIENLDIRSVLLVK